MTHKQKQSPELGTFDVENARHVGCCVCNDWAQGALCRKHRRALADCLSSLRKGLYELQSIARREERVDVGGEGHAHPAFASTPMDLAAQDLIDETEDVLQQVASACGVWAGGSWQVLLRKLPARISRVQSLADYRRLMGIEAKVNGRITPPIERILIGRCLTKGCYTLLSIVRGQQVVECPSCGMVQSVSDVWAQRLNGLRAEGARTDPMTPSQAARWLRRETHAHVTRQAVYMRWTRGMMPNTEEAGDGSYRFDKSELLDLVEAVATRRE